MKKLPQYLFCCVCVSILFSRLVCVNADANETIDVDASIVLKSFSSPLKPVGINASFLLDSDMHFARDTTTEDQFYQMQVGSVRFPFGHLANNYLWDDDGTYGGVLTPKVAASNVTPGNWTWAVDPSDRSLTSSMDFDEYLEMADRLGFEPFVVVNVMGHRYPNGPTFSKIVESAREWVKYAKLRHENDGMPKVKYWQLGNEQDHHAQYWKSPFLPLNDSWDDGVNNTCLGISDDGLADDGVDENDYINIYKVVAAAMKQEDPSILTGPGLLNSKVWFNQLWQADPENVDFVSAHQYTFGQAWAQGGYASWRDFTGNMVFNISGMQDRLDNTGDPDGDGLDPYHLELMVTEMSPFGTWPEGSGIVDTYRSLALFEMQMEALAVRNTKFTYFWTSRSPFGGDGNNPTYLASALTTDTTGKRTATADIMKIINENLFDELLSSTRQSGKVRSYVTRDYVTGDVSMFLLNKDSASTAVSVNFSNYNLPDNYDRYVFKGDSHDDPSPVLAEQGSISKNGNSFDTVLDPVSLTVIRFSPSLAAHWRFDESSGGTAADDSGNSLDAVLYGGSGFQAGVMGNGLNLDGVDGYAETPFVIDPSVADFTAIGWVKLDAANGTRQAILQQLGGGATWLFRNVSDGSVGSWGGSAITSTATIPVGEWCQVGVVVEGNYKYVVVNGKLEGGLMANAFPSVSAGMRIGRHKNPDAVNEEWDGMIDDLRIYNKALSNAEILALYHAGAPEAPPEEPIVSEFFVDQSFGTNPMGWSVNEISGTATVEGKPNEPRTAFSSYDPSLRLRDTGSDIVSANKTWPAQSGKLVIEFETQVNTRRGGAWYYIKDSSGTVAVRLKVDSSSNEIWTWDGSSAVSIQSSAFSGFKDMNRQDNDCSAAEIIKSRKVTIIADPASDSYTVNGSSPYAFLNNVGDIGQFSFQTVQADESESPWVDEMSDYDVNLDYLVVLKHTD